MKKFWKITGITFGVLLLLIGGGIVFLYWKLTSIDLGDIKTRHTVASSGQVSTDGSTTVPPVEGKEAELPSALDGAVSKAEQIAGKSIKTQDAVDAAAILLKSGLSMREMYSLLGQSTEKLTNEEKQTIRDLLLKKLTKEEIELLRSITVKYNKELLILDPDYPIELIGIEDPKERAQIKKQLEAEGKLKGPSSTPVVSKTESGSEKDNTSETTVADNKPAPTETDDTGKATDSDNALFVKIKAKYESELASLKASCQGEANANTSEVVAAIKANKDKSEGTINAKQQALLVQIAKAESTCDTKFSSLMSTAHAEFKDTGISSASIEQTWRSQYDSVKSSMRSQAISHIKSALKS
ncbi:hypothetical protein ACFPYJ_12105 [Paenibacillus solisilvae]|uniref:Uncharacterized protein n=1 Tax=Paenibacillus solisilvae TaxID=2486751 RepID=A0ABW0VVK3_9BACL